MKGSMHNRGVNKTAGVFYFGVVSFTVLALMLGCIEGGTGGFYNVDGEVMGESFQMYGGVAEATGSGYWITITDSSSYDCVSTPSSNYLQVTWETAGVGSTAAAGNVTFSRVEGNISPSDPAVSGEVVIDSVDVTNGFIAGSITAQGSSSDVSGSFEIEICP